MKINKNAQVFVFGGTTEAGELAKALEGHGSQVFLSVATEYGAGVAEDLSGVIILQGRLTAQEMIEIFSTTPITHVVDATHPFAVEVSANIRRATEECGLPYYRLVREESTVNYGEIFTSEEEIVASLNQHVGNILLTTGSKTLESFTEITDYQHRVYLRILPMVSSLEKAVGLGYHPRRILALQGPFSKNYNKALLEEYNISAMVTKESGKTGGFTEKVEACKEAGVSLYILKRPEETGTSLGELLELFTGEGKI